MKKKKLRYRALKGTLEGEYTFLPQSPSLANQLRQFFRWIIAHYPYYQEVFRDSQASLDEDPFLLLARLPSLSRQHYRERLQKESFDLLARQAFVHDRSSGSYSEPVIRYSNWHDELAEEQLTVRAFELTGINAQDSVLSLEVGVPEIYTYYHRALYQLGVRDSYYVNLTYQFERALDIFEPLNPSTLISVPTVLYRAFPKLKEMYQKLKKPRLKRILYMGEQMSSDFRRILQEHFQVEVFSFYGTTEVGGCAIECKAHQGGHHLFYDTVLPTLRQTRQVEEDCYEGEVFFTPLHLQSQSLVKYEVHDLIRLSFQPCPCGENSPQMEFIQRKFDFFPIYGIKFRYGTFQELLAKHFGSMDLLQICIEPKNLETTRVRFLLPETYQPQHREIEAVLASVYEFDTLLNMKLVEMQVEYQALSALQTRKLKRVLDTRSTPLL
jgi:phenylacetate-coenzyme A ligase PaaK-like adenylate-forming protein